MRIIRTLLPFALVGGLFAAAATPAVATTAAPAHTAAAPAHTTAAPKPVPAPPPGVAVGSVKVPKPSGSHAKAVSPLTTWSVTLTASSTNLWPTQFTTLTATSNNDVGPTPYYIDIRNQSTGVLVGHCGTGTVCSVAVTSNTPADQGLIAYLSDATDVNGNHAVAFSRSISVTWMGVDLSLTASAYTLPAGNVSTLTVTAGSDISSSPFYLQIWDTTTGAFLIGCGFGNTCSTTVSLGVATTHAFTATFAGDSRSYPPPLLQSTSGTDYITWTGSGLRISLDAPALAINGPATVTATASINVGPTPYFIEIFDETTGARITFCSTGNTCSVGYFAGRSVTSHLVAFISNSDIALPPANIQASSNTATMESVVIG
ncbi:MAG: hypothetical protein ACJ786_05180 [Catenulispora sp.]